MKSFAQQRRWGRKRLIKRGIVVALLLCAGIMFPYSRGVQTTNDGVSQVSIWISAKLGRVLTLEEVVWEEVGSSNLSYHVNKELLLAVSGLKLGQSMLEIDLENLEKKLLAVPWIEFVRMQKKLPSSLVVQYGVHQARALGLRGNKAWLISSDGHWIRAIDHLQRNDVDLPLITEEKTMPAEMDWLDTLERELKPHLLQVHELGVTAKDPRLNALIELRYSSQSAKISLIAWEHPQQQALNRLKRVVQYLIKNNILVSSIDLRAGQKVVVNVGKRL